MLGDVARKFATSQMARTLATLLGGGLPLVNALDIAAHSIGNQYMAAQLDIVSTRVREGESFAAALEARKAFPEVAVKMAEVGESDRRAAGHAQYRGRLLRRRDFHEHGAVRHPGRADPAGRDGHRDRRAAAGALHAALPVELGAGTRTWPQTRHASQPACPACRRDWKPTTAGATSSMPPKSTRLAAKSSRRRGVWPNATASSSWTWTRSGSTRTCSGRFRPISCSATASCRRDATARAS